mmetsp:Transcript_854/g.1350  ORF Transcript_854/g.1350 Transcript_854/m.1350 type:complete len:383 (-) Transcript_854:387-1535(-)|eukprot:CAMPEP_0196814224 /NCGR_PEP_ID=MMETSP1362-20130617/42028_1 /TAXON_ID=163516 /ORGANISM="Leptocylindrus danicus, Strain CCMP1856" /LENGTH=382 /DNA_ID=CAMNT_0042190771 /DNA_START=32 /DNA_END=1180 /DNA_ORIENTATION=+
MSTPQAVTDALDKLGDADKAVIELYIDELKHQIIELGGEIEDDCDGDDDDDDSMPPLEGNEPDADDEGPVEGATMEKDSVSDFPPIYESGEDMDKAMECKMQASDLKSTGDYKGAVDKYTEAICAAQPSALTYAGRAECLFNVNRPCAAIRDCDEAIKLNPDSAKALRVRGRAHRAVGNWELARKDLSAAQSIDFDDTAMADLKFVTEKVSEIEAKKVKERLAEEEKKKKKIAEIKKAQEEAKAAAEREQAERASPSSSGMPGNMPMPGMPAGMPTGMNDLFNDPDVMAGLQNPKIMAAFQGMMTGGGMDMSKIQKLMTDPETAGFMQKIIGKMGGSMGGMSGMGGMGGMGMPPGGFGGAGSGDDDMPDLDDGDYDDMPDLE